MPGLSTLVVAAALATTGGLAGGHNHGPPEFKYLSLSGTGNLLIYHTAALREAIAQDIVNPATVKGAGASGGALAMAVLCSGGSLDFLEAVMTGNIETPQPPPADVYAALQGLTNLVLGPNWQNCNGRLQVQLTKVPDTEPANTTCSVGGQSLVVHQFDTRDVLVNAVAASMFVVKPEIPFLAKCYVEFNGMKVKDGFHVRTQAVWQDVKPNGQLKKPKHPRQVLGLNPFPEHLWETGLVGAGEIEKYADIWPGVDEDRPAPVSDTVYLVGLLAPVPVWTPADVAAVKAGAVLDVQYFVSDVCGGGNDRRVLRGKH